MPGATVARNRTVCVGCLFLRTPSRVPYRTELIPRAPKGRRNVPSALHGGLAGAQSVLKPMGHVFSTFCLLVGRRGACF